MIRIGQGYDVHQFGDGDAIMLGGVCIPHNRGIVAHSDGDVLLHALCDALLGAAALGDIGRHFSDTDIEYSGADSRELLRHVLGLLHHKGFTVGNVDMTIVAQAPKVTPFMEQIRRNVADDLEVNIAQVNVKATTTEYLGFEGRKEGIAAQAVVLIS